MARTPRRRRRSLDLIRRDVRLLWAGATLALLGGLAAPAAAAPGGCQDTVAAGRGASGSGPVLYVGDSLGVGTIPQLRSLLPGVSIEGQARTGRGSTDGLSVLRARLRHRHRIVIFDLGTNDARPATLRRNLERARSLSGDRLMIVFTINRPGVGALNRMVRTFATSNANVALIDWRSKAAKEHLLGGDGVHADARGYRRRALPIVDCVADPDTARPDHSLTEIQA